jgi:hypothetical protein
MDPEMNVHNIEITDTETPDIEMIDNLIPEEIASSLEKIIADGGYYSKEVVEELYNKGIIPAIPPPSNSVVQGKSTTLWHDKIVQNIKDKGSIYAFHKKYGYGVRALVEAQISRIKRCIGSSLKTKGLNPKSERASLLPTSSTSGTHLANAFALRQDNYV